RLQGHNSFAIWFAGLSGSGKSTLASALEKRLYQRGLRTFILDGDNIRSGLNKDLDFSEESRRENIRRIGEVAKLMIDAGCIVLSAFISPFRQEREMVKSMVGEENYVEVFVNCPLEECEKRDVKGLYAKARAGEISNFTGISSPFEAPENPDVKVPTHQLSLEEGVERIIFENPVLLFSGGKDSIVLTHLARKAFWPAKIPFPLMHVDTGHNFPETMKFRDDLVKSLGVKLIVGSVQESIDTGRVREETGKNASRNALQTTTLLDTIEKHNIDAAMGGARRDEEKARAKERFFSHRDDFGQWDPKNQRPELWNQFNGKKHMGEHFR
ncbi:cysC, partial [Symbiodinium sp. CCMP2456]